MRENIPETDDDVYRAICDNFMQLDALGKEAAWRLYQWYRYGRYLTLFDAYEKVLQAMIRPDSEKR